jgi:uncharacterized protein (DUF2252 family)
MQANTPKQPRPTQSQRAKILLRQQQLKMARSAHAYVRGNTVKFYEWLKASEGKVPQGPAIWICGDCHIGNLGPVSDFEGNVEIEIRDLDQTVIGNPAHDLIRLALSLAMASRSSDLPGVTTALMIEQVIAGYCDALRTGKARLPTSKAASEPVRLVMKEALSRKWRHLANERIEDVRPTIPLGPKFWALNRAERKEIDTLFESKEAQALVAILRKEGKKHKPKVLDAAYWMKGCSSLGRLRYAVLLSIGKSFCLIDIKEATAAAAPKLASHPMPSDPAKRVVAGAHALSPYLGERMVATRIAGRPVFIRELRPQDLKFELEEITQDQAIQTARFLAGVVGRAHARQMDIPTRKKWLSTLKKQQAQNPKNIKAPNWLWTSTVELAGAHEMAYLEHCRQFALTPQ